MKLLLAAAVVAVVLIVYLLASQSRDREAFGPKRPFGRDSSHVFMNDYYAPLQPCPEVTPMYIPHFQNGPADSWCWCECPAGNAFPSSPETASGKMCRCPCV